MSKFVIGGLIIHQLFIDSLTFLHTEADNSLHPLKGFKGCHNKDNFHPPIHLLSASYLRCLCKS